MISLQIISAFLLIIVSVAKIDCGMPGGWIDHPTNSTKITDAADFAFKRVNAGMNSLSYLKMLNIINAQSQVVAGVKYRITFDVGHTKCKRNENLTNEALASCELDDSMVSISLCFSTSSSLNFLILIVNIFASPAERQTLCRTHLGKIMAQGAGSC